MTDGDPRHAVLWDQLRLSNSTLRLARFEVDWLELLDGGRTVREVQVEAMRRNGGQLVPLEAFARLVDVLDEALFLEGPRFRQRIDNPVRQPACIGCYEGDPKTLREQLRGFFIHPKGPGLPDQPRSDGRLRAALIPHIDYLRGGPTFAWAFKEVFERADATLFVIIGTAHYSPHRFTLTRKDFQTPLGIVKTAGDYVDRLVRHYGDGLFDDELCHLPEHSIELEVVFLQYLYEGKKDFRIVPLLVGPFSDCVEENRRPAEKDDIARMIAALRQTEAETEEAICYIISGDLAHIGPKFGDPEPVHAEQLDFSHGQDHALLRQAAAADTASYFEVIAGEKDARRICGLPPTYITLEVAKPGSGKVLHYDRYVHPRGHESVSFASVAFYR